MSELTPEQIFNAFKTKELDRSTTIQYLKSIIENNNDRHKSLEALIQLSKMPLHYKDDFKFLESLLVSDAREYIRSATAKIIIQHFLIEGYELLKWMIEHEESINNLNEVFRLLKTNKTKQSQLLNQDFKRILISRFSNMNPEQKESIGLGSLERSMGLIQTYLTDFSYIADIGYKKIHELLEEIDILYDEHLLSEALQSDYIKILEYLIGIYSDPSDMGEDNKYNECRPKDFELVRHIGDVALKIDSANEIILKCLSWIDAEVKTDKFKQALDFQKEF